MRIGVFTDSYTPYVSGVVRSVRSFTRELTRLGHEVYLFAPAYPGGPEGPGGTQGPEGPEGPRAIFRFRSIPAPNYKGFVLPIPISLKAVPLARQLGLEVLHSHTPFLLGSLAARVARGAGLPLVFTHHTLYHLYAHYVPLAGRLAAPAVVRLLARYCSRADLVVAPTEPIREMIAELYRTEVPIEVIPTGIDLDPFQEADRSFLKGTLGIAPDEPVVLFLGRIGKEKNVGLALEAFARLAAEEPSAHMVFAGDGPLSGWLAAEVRRSEFLAGRVHLVGAVPPEQVARYYAGADLFLNPSVTETQGLVTLEAMAAGLPVVAVDAAGSRDLVREGVEGLLAPEDPTGLAARLLLLIRSPQLRRQMASAARARAAEYGAPRMAKRLESAYARVIAARQPRRSSSPS